MTFKLEAMAFGRDTWISKASQRLEGAVGEYAKLKYAQLVDFPDYWSNEVAALMKKVEELFDPIKVKTKQKFDRIKAFEEALHDSLGCQEQVTAARNEFIHHLKTVEAKKNFLKVSMEAKLDSEALLIEMISKYLPKKILIELSKE